jgi:hypothetical protein
LNVRDRILELRRVPASELRPNPRNWRVHPAAQRDALRGVLAEIGYADALLARESADGTLTLIDGHLRAETTPEATVPVLVLDVNDAEADKILATIDPLGAMAGTAEEQLAALVADVTTENAALQTLLDELVSGASGPAEGIADPPEVALREWYQVVVECRDEQDQRDVFERMRAQGYRCRVLTL